MVQEGCDGKLELASELISRVGRLVVLTGAGISTESGIPDFQSPGTIWKRFSPREFTYQKFISSIETRRRAWQLSHQLYPLLARAEPNLAHLALLELERLGKLRAIITQNIDGLHQKAGHKEGVVLELHGTIHMVVCVECGQRYPREKIQCWLETGVEIPLCSRCGGILKHATVSYGQSVPREVLAEAKALAREADLFMVVGSSLRVHPAANLPLLAKSKGAKLVIMNETPTFLDSRAEVVMLGRAGELLPAMVVGLKRGPCYLGARPF